MNRLLFRGALGLLVVSSLASCPAHAPVATPPPDVVVARQPWWKGAVFYEIFVRSFRDSNGDGIGDLNGLIEKLDYLNDGDPKTYGDLGVDALWLMPVFESPSSHGYDTVDYDTIERDYGTNQDFERLLSEAHRRGIKVIVDLVLNHTSSQHPWFIDSAKGASAAHRDWYVWSDTNPGWGQPWNPSEPAWHQRNGAWYYGVFWGGMPDLNFRAPEVQQELTRIASQWVRRGVDGFRLDAVKHLVETGPGAGQAGSPENHAFLRQLGKALRSINPQVVLVGEVWSNTADIAQYFGTDGDELDGLFNFPLATALVNGAWSGDAQDIVKALGDMRAAYPSGALDAPFLTNHDQTRVATALGKDTARLRLAAAMLLTLPGAPFIYYGEEIGMPNGPGGGDEKKRTPMLWAGPPGYGFTTGTPWEPISSTQVVPPPSEQAAIETSLWSRYRDLIRIRRSSVALTSGNLEILPAPNEVLLFLRREGADVVLVAHNLGSAAAQVAIEPGPGQAAKPLHVDPGVRLESNAKGSWALTLPGRSSGVWHCD